jgi:serine/threonine protein phosphatase 1
MLRQFLSRFSSKAAPPQTFQMEENTRIYAVGDIHGRHDILRQMMQQIEEDAAQAADGTTVVEIFLGDYIDRGPDSRKVIETLIQPSPHGHERLCLRGNHEQSMLNFLEDPTRLRPWVQYGGYATLLSYGIEMPVVADENSGNFIHAELCQKLPREHFDWLNALPHQHIRGDYFFAHAGVNPSRPLDAQEPEELMWIRDRFLNHSAPFSHHIVHGHTPMAAPETLPHRTNLDVSAAETDQLACLVIEGTERRLLLTD